MPGVLFLEIDGLAHDVLRPGAARRQRAEPRRAGCASGSHRLERWETDWSSQTGACQAGLLHGNNDDMPAFRWWEKDRGAAIVTNHPRDADELERRHSDGRGLLHADGASRANILSGDAPHSMLTMSTVLHRRRPIGRDYAAYFARPYAVARTLVAGARRRLPRAPRGARSSAATTCSRGSPRTASYAARPRLGDGRPARPAGRGRASATCSPAGRSIYTTFLAYDEVAHHSGIERARHARRAAPRSTARSPGSRRAVRRRAAALPARRPLRPRPVAGRDLPATATARRSRTLVRAACDAGEHDRGRAAARTRRSAYLGAGLTEVARDDTAAGRTVRAGDPRATRRRRGDARRRGSASRGDDARRRAARALGDGLGLPRPDQLPARARPGDARADRGALPAA